MRRMHIGDHRGARACCGCMCWQAVQRCLHLPGIKALPLCEQRALPEYCTPLHLRGQSEGPELDACSQAVLRCLHLPGMEAGPGGGRPLPIPGLPDPAAAQHLQQRAHHGQRCAPHLAGQQHPGRCLRCHHARPAIVLVTVQPARLLSWQLIVQAATVTWAELMVRQRLGLSHKTMHPAEGLQAVADYAAQLLRQTPAARGRLRANDAYALSSEYKHLSG